MKNKIGIPIIGITIVTQANANSASLVSERSLENDSKLIFLMSQIEITSASKNLISCFDLSSNNSEELEKLDAEIRAFVGDEYVKTKALKIHQSFNNQMVSEESETIKNESQNLAAYIGNNFPTLYATIVSQNEKQGLNLNNYGSAVANVQAVVNLAVYANVAAATHVAVAAAAVAVVAAVVV